MIPQVGDPVLILVDPVLNNGSDVAPGVLTRVGGMGGAPGKPGFHQVNAKAFLDSTAADQWITSADLFDTEQEARDVLAQNPDMRALFRKSATIR